MQNRRRGYTHITHLCHELVVEASRISEDHIAVRPIIFQERPLQHNTQSIRLRKVLTFTMGGGRTNRVYVSHLVHTRTKKIFEIFVISAVGEVKTQ